MIIYKDRTDFPAVIQNDRTIGYQEFCERINAVAGIAKDIPEKNLGIYMDARIESLEIYLGLIFAGKTLLPLPNYFPPQFVGMLKNMIGVERIVGLGTGTLDPSEISYEKYLLSSGGNGYEISKSGGLIVMTSGTEGIPKIMKHSYQTMTSSHNADYREINPNYRCLLTAPMDSGVGLFSALWYLDAESTIAIENNRMTADVVVESINKYRCNLVSIYKTALRKIVDAGHDRNSLPSLESIIETGSPSQQFVDSFILDKFGHILYNLYASSELGNISSEWVGMESGGRQFPKIKLDIKNIDETGIGEIWGNAGAMPEQIYGMSGPQTISRDEYLTSGDYGYFNEDGLLVIAGRRSDKIITSGYKVYAGLVEKEINSIDGVYRSAVIGIEDDKVGQRIVAYIDGTASIEKIKNVLSDRLPFYMIPKEFNFVSKLPEGPTGKILKKELLSL